MFSYTQAAMERTMKVQEVILRAMGKKITWWQAAEIIGISDRQMRRWRERYEEFGFRGLFDRRRGKPSPKKVPMAVVEKVLGLYREKYFDLNVRHFHEKLRAEHQVEISYSWVKGLLQGAGMVAQGRQRGVHRQQRPLPTGRSNNFAFATQTRPSPSGTSSITFTPSCTILNIASATPPTCAANCRAFPSQPFLILLCHPERSRMVRKRTILRSRGTCFLAALKPGYPRAVPLRNRTAGLSTA
jgi:transposase